MFSSRLQISLLPVLGNSFKMSLSPLTLNSLLPCPSLLNEVESLADTGIIDYEESSTTVQVGMRNLSFLH